MAHRVLGNGHSVSRLHTRPSRGRLRNFKFRLDSAKLPEGENAAIAEHAGRALAEFRAAMDDDLNTAEALGAVFEFLRDANTALDKGEFLAGNLGAAQALLEQFDV